MQGVGHSFFLGRACGSEQAISRSTSQDEKEKGFKTFYRGEKTGELKGASKK